jgi:hypothetical protein
MLVSRMKKDEKEENIQHLYLISSGAFEFFGCL